MPDARAFAEELLLGFDELDDRIIRVGASYMPVPFAPTLEQAYRPSVDQVVGAIRRTMGKE